MDPTPALTHQILGPFPLVFTSPYRDWGGLRVRTVHTHATSSSIPRSITYPKKECTGEGKKKERKRKLRSLQTHVLSKEEMFHIFHQIKQHNPPGIRSLV